MQSYIIPCLYSLGSHVIYKYESAGYNKDDVDDLQQSVYSIIPIC